MTRGISADTEALQSLTPPGLLGDTSARDYSRKLQSFNSFAAPELRQGIASLNLRPGMRILDAGCGTGEALAWLHEAVTPGGLVVGIDLATAHLNTAREQVDQSVAVLQADLMKRSLTPESFDLIWSVNTINHMRDRLLAVNALVELLRPNGRIVLGQSSFVPDMYFAWNARLERLTNEAVRAYYCKRYGLDERSLTDIRSLVGLLRQAQLHDVRAQTYLIERVSPLAAADDAYLREAIFHDTWGERLRPYLAAEDFAELTRLSDPSHPQFALRRPDFHFLQSFTLVTGQIT